MAKVILSPVAVCMHCAANPPVADTHRRRLRYMQAMRLRMVKALCAGFVFGLMAGYAIAEVLR